MISIKRKVNSVMKKIDFNNKDVAIVAVAAAAVAIAGMAAAYAIARLKKDALNEISGHMQE